MEPLSEEKPNYGNWVSIKFIYIPGAIGLFFLGLAIAFPILFVVAALFLFVALYFAYSRYLFSPRGGNIQDKVRELVLSGLDWDGNGRILDIGCGSGALAIELANKYKGARVVGIDYWGKQWEYSKKICEKNAEIAGVADRVTFLQTSAAALPFNNDSFDAVVSNLVFHEVRGVRDKKELIREALRVTKKGGKFSLQDLFLWKQIYGEPDELIKKIKGWGVLKIKFVDASRSSFIPPVLKLPFMLGSIGLIAGEK